MCQVNLEARAAPVSRVGSSLVNPLYLGVEQ
jgi:hypothetical protein